MCCTISEINHNIEYAFIITKNVTDIYGPSHDNYKRKLQGYVIVNSILVVLFKTCKLTKLSFVFDKVSN